MTSCTKNFRWRFALLHSTLFILAIVVSGCASSPGKGAPTDRDLQVLEEVNWEWLFDGSNLDHWAGLNAPPSDRWVIDAESNLLHKLPSNKENYGGDLRTKERYQNFELCFDFKLTQGANSGVKYNVSEAISAQQGHPSAAIGFEFQVLDDAYHPDAKAGVDGNRTVGGLYDLYPPVLNKPKVVAGVWYTGCVLAQANKISHSLNGQIVLEYQPGSADFERRLAASKFAGIENFALRQPGYIVLQDHVDELWYRNIKIRRLP